MSRHCKGGLQVVDQAGVDRFGDRAASPTAREKGFPCYAPDKKTWNDLDMLKILLAQIAAHPDGNQARGIALDKDHERFKERNATIKKIARLAILLLDQEKSGSRASWRDRENPAACSA